MPLPYPNVSLVPMGPNGGQDNDSQRTLKGSGSSRRRRPIQGAQRIVLIISLLVGLLFSSLDSSIVATSLVTISHDFNDFVNAPWIVLSYLLTYMGFAICLSKLSDIYGRRNVLVGSWVIFVGFSLGCATAKDMTSLIVCRAFQGIGASGLYSLTQIGLLEVGPVHRPSLIGAMIGVTLALAFVLGPLIGGAISHLSDWRWLFNMNIPFGLVTIVSLATFWPEEEVSGVFSWKSFKRIDFIGSATLLCSSGLLVFAIQQAGSQTFPWNSPAIITALVISFFSGLTFAIWEWKLDHRADKRVEPIFPVKLMQNRVYAAALLVTFLTGYPYIALCIVLPERFQIVNQESALMAGVHLLPLLGACAVGSFLGGKLSDKKNNTSYTLIASSCLQLLGVGLMLLVSAPTATPPSQYGFQVIFGLGVGLSLSSATILSGIHGSSQRDRASAQGAIAQARVLGGCIGLSICTVIFTAHVNKYLEDHLTEEQLKGLHRSPLSGINLPVDLRDLVKHVYSAAFAQEIKVMVAICGAMVLGSLLTLERHPEPLSRLTEGSNVGAVSRRSSDSGHELGNIATTRETV